MKDYQLHKSQLSEIHGCLDEDAMFLIGLLKPHVVSRSSICLNSRKKMRLEMKRNELIPSTLGFETKRWLCHDESNYTARKVTCKHGLLGDGTESQEINPTPFLLRMIKPVFYKDRGIRTLYDLLLRNTRKCYFLDIINVELLSRLYISTCAIFSAIIKKLLNRFCVRGFFSSGIFTSY